MSDNYIYKGERDPHFKYHLSILHIKLVNSRRSKSESRGSFVKISRGFCHGTHRIRGIFYVVLYIHGKKRAFVESLALWSIHTAIS